jgi:hypothetical protein
MMLKPLHTRSYNLVKPVKAHFADNSSERERTFILNCLQKINILKSFIKINLFSVAKLETE